MGFGADLHARVLTSHLTDRSDHRSATADQPPGELAYVLVRGGDIAVSAAPSGQLQLVVMPAAELAHYVLGSCGEPVRLGERAGLTVLTADLTSHSADALRLPPGTRFDPLRGAGLQLSMNDANLALSAVAMTTWHRDTRYCPTCGEELETRRDGWMKSCSQRHLQFPRTDAAMIVAVTDAEDRLLLARNHRSTSGTYSVLAGFLEPGEDLETCVQREVLEEVGLLVEDVRYVGSQPWPYPRSLMVGFRARVGEKSAPDELELRDGELEDARFLTREQFEEQLASGEIAIPPIGSVGRALIDMWAGAVPDPTATQLAAHQSDPAAAREDAR